MNKLFKAYLKFLLNIEPKTEEDQYYDYLFFVSKEKSKLNTFKNINLFKDVYSFMKKLPTVLVYPEITFDENVITLDWQVDATYRLLVVFDGRNSYKYNKLINKEFYETSYVDITENIPIDMIKYLIQMDKVL